MIYQVIPTVKYHTTGSLIIGEIRTFLMRNKPSLCFDDTISLDKSLSLKLDFNITLWLTAAGQDLTGLDKGQRLLVIANLALQQTQAARATIAGAALVLDLYLMVFERFQQIAAIRWGGKLSTGGAQRH